MKCKTRIIIIMQIPLGVLLLNENEFDKMSQILTKLAPTFPAEGHHVLPNGSVINFNDTRFFSILFGGDQLTVACIHGIHAPLRDTHDKAIHHHCD